MSPDQTSSGGLGPVLGGLLLRSLSWVVLVALLVAGVVWWASGRSTVVDRVRTAVFGPPGPPEPRARIFLRVSFGLLWLADGLLQAQPRMPAAFVGQVQAQVGGSAWLAGLVDPLLRAWSRHPVTADAVTVWVQVGLGLLFLVGRRGRLATLASWAAIGWGLVVWVLGEGLGGLLQAGAGWLSGAPGAVLPYLVAAVLLLVPWHWWDSGRAQVLARRSAGAFLAVAALLQALPAEGSWTPTGAAAPFSMGAAHTQPAPLVRPIAGLAALALHHPVAVNATVVALAAVAAAVLWLSGRTLVLVPVLVLCALTWWLAQDLGVVGGTATDPGTAPALGLLVAACLPCLRGSSREPAASAAERRPGAARLRAGLGAAAGTVAVALTLVLPLLLVLGLPGPADATAVAADSAGGVRAIPPRPAPDFDLVDQQGRPVSTSSLRGKLVLLTFLDPVCSSDCPLIGNQLAAADRQLGDLASRVEIVAIDTNPVFDQMADVAAFTESHGLADLPNWHFVYGPPDTVQDVLAQYGIAVAVPTVGMIEHSEGIYFITPDGREAAYLEDGAAEQLTTAYTQQIRDEIRSLL